MAVLSQKQNFRNSIHVFRKKSTENKNRIAFLDDLDHIWCKATQMIHEFRCKNVLSFKEEVELSFEATADKTHRDYYCVDVKPNLSLLKIAIIYGQNASGKTNVIRALQFLAKLATSSSNDKTDPIPFNPFLLDDESRNGFSSYHLSFFIEGKRFIYDIEHNAQYIRSEKLVYYPGSQPATVFVRSYNPETSLSEVKFGGILNLTQKEEIILEGSVIKNTSLIGVYAKSNVEVEVLDLVKNYFDVTFMHSILPSTDLTGWTSSMIEDDEQKRSFVVDQLKKADFNIGSINFKEEEIELNDELLEAIKESGLSIEKKEEALKNKKIKLKNISFVHETNNGDFNLRFRQQSSGTQRFYGLSGALEEVITNNHVLAIDEIESSLHSHLVSHLFKLFLVNSKMSQLIFTTHDLLLMSSEIIRRDVVWFTDKGESGSSELYAASDFKLHVNKSIFRQYQLGKLGATPDLGDIFTTISN